MGKSSAQLVAVIFASPILLAVGVAVGIGAGLMGASILGLLFVSCGLAIIVKRHLLNQKFLKLRAPDSLSPAFWLGWVVLGLGGGVSLGVLLLLQS